MNDAIGGVVNLGLIMFFIVTIALYMAFNVNYQKAFNVKNRIVELYEEYDGNCYHTSECKDEIEKYEKNIGYGSVSQTRVGNLCTSANMKHAAGYGYCHNAVEVTGATAEDDVVEESRKTCYYEILTFVEIDIPIINNLLKLRMFQVTGQTKQMKIAVGKKCEDLIG